MHVRTESSHFLHVSSHLEVGVVGWLGAHEAAARYASMSLGFVNRAYRGGSSSEVSWMLARMAARVVRGWRSCSSERMAGVGGIVAAELIVLWIGLMAGSGLVSCWRRKGCNPLSRLTLFGSLAVSAREVALARMLVGLGGPGVVRIVWIDSGKGRV